MGVAKMTVRSAADGAGNLSDGIAFYIIEQDGGQGYLGTPVGGIGHGVCDEGNDADGQYHQYACQMPMASAAQAGTETENTLHH